MPVSGFSNYLEDRVLNHVFGGVTLAQPAAVYVALHTADPEEDGSGAQVTGGSYARQAATFAASSGGSKATSANLVFADMPAATVTHVSIWDAVSGGNMLAGGALSVSKVVGAGDTFQITSGNLVVNLN